MQNRITFFDVEVNPKTEKITDIGAVNSNGGIFHALSFIDFKSFISSSDYLCGHNAIKHDAKYLKAVVNGFSIIDTLYLSPLFFPQKPYHSLLKDEKLQTEERNNPVNDSKKCKDLFFEQITAFDLLADDLKDIYYHLLCNTPEYTAFFSYLNYQPKNNNVSQLITHYFNNRICINAVIQPLIDDFPIELALSLSLINTKESFCANYGHLKSRSIGN